jgi:hypothetical protein
LLAGIIAITCNYLIGYIPIALAPGFNPMRHLPDCVLVVAICLQYRDRKARNFAVTSVLIFLGILWNKEFGLAVFVANCASIAVFLLCEREGTTIRFRSQVVLAALVPAVALALLPQGSLAAPPVNILLGITAPTTGWDVILKMLAFFSVTALPILYSGIKRRADFPYFYLFLWINATVACVYFIWNSLPHHFWTFIRSNIPFIIVFISTSLGILFPMQEKAHRASLRLVSILVAFVLANFFISPEHPPLNVFGKTFGLNSFKIDMADFDRRFESHVIYDERTRRGRFLTPMVMRPLDADIGMIERHAGEGRKMTLLSIHDCLFPILVDRYNDIPFITLPLNLVSRESERELADFLEKKRPTVIFADKDLFESDLFESINPYDPVLGFLWGTVQQRLLTYAQFKDIVRRSLTGYRKIEDGFLLSAYELTGTGREAPE